MPFGIYSTVRPSPHGNNGELRKKCVAIEKDWKAATPKRRQWKTHEWGGNVKRKLILEVAQRGYGTRTRNIPRSLPFPSQPIWFRFPATLSSLGLLVPGR